MRIVHTADWHLGHVLHDRDRDAEHRAFLKWLLDLLNDEEVDALLICGDVFEGANPSASAQALWYGFLADAARRCPGLQVVVIAGNHDSPARLEAPAPILEVLQVRVVGLLPRSGNGLDLDRLIFPLAKRPAPGQTAKEVGAWVAAVPFLRLSDVSGVAPTNSAVIDGARAIYAEAIEAAGARCTNGEAIVVMGHCYVEGMRLSEESERKILGGNQHPLLADFFPSDIGYVALGHLHLAQEVGGREEVRYSGSPIPLSLDEVHYPHQVCVVELEPGQPGQVRPIRVPRSVDILRLPSEPRPLLEVLPVLEALPAARQRDPLADDLRPYLEVRLLRDGSGGGFRTVIADAVEGKDVRLVKITLTKLREEQTLAETTDASLAELTTETVFRRLWERSSADPPSPELLAAFHELVHEAGQEAGQ